MKATRKSVIEAARNSGRELTEKQVTQILDRHAQLLREGRDLAREKRYQIDWCWRWHGGN